MRCADHRIIDLQPLAACKGLLASALLALTSVAAAQVPPPVSAVDAVHDFEHPPLRYRGPDPLARQFLPVSVIGGGQGLLAPPELPPSQFLAPQHGYPGETIDSFLPPQDAYQEFPPAPVYDLGSVVSDHKDGFFQKIRFVSTWIDRNDKFDDFGLTEFDLLATFAAPLPSREWPLLITPAFKSRLIDGPRHVDVPETLYESYLEFLWLPRFNQRWTAIIGVAGGIYSDFEVDDNDAWRMTGTGLVRYDWSPGSSQVVLGVLYVNRRDVRLLPAGGIIWTPAPDRRYEVLFPRPKLAHRIAHGPAFEDWIYFGGEFGGNSYSIERINGMPDIITLRDFRTYLGLERKLNGGAGYHIEIGYVMGRVIEFESATPDVEADPTAVLRGGITY